MQEKRDTHSLTKQKKEDLTDDWEGCMIKAQAYLKNDDTRKGGIMTWLQL